MTLSQIFDGIVCSIHGNADTEVGGIAYDSRRVKPGDLFFCIDGTSVDGNVYAAAAVEKGAAAIATTRLHSDLDVPQVVVEDDRKAMALASAAFYGWPSRRMRMIGVTGTNGKTTTTYMFKRIAEQAGHKVGLLGTIRNLIGERVVDAVRTTPESPDLHRLLRTMYDEGCDMVIMEVSSHSLALDRTYGIAFDVGVFSNLTQDHLDFHKTFDAYLRAKELLFEQSGTSIVNADDPHGPQMAEHAQGSCVSYSAQTAADYRALNIELGPEHVSYTLRTSGDSINVLVPIPGMFTVYNSLAALSAAAEAGVPIELGPAALAGMSPVDGRFEVLDTRGRNFTLILDYAHTPDSLENTLETIREFARGRVVTVFGCGGDRDRSKRPIMGEIAARLSDCVYVTSDNPRFEDPERIIEDIERGIPESFIYQRVPDRREAIREAIAGAQKDDVVLLAGKGHETYQEICGVKHDFDEKIVVREVFDELGW